MTQMIWYFKSLSRNGLACHLGRCVTLHCESGSITRKFRLKLLHFGRLRHAVVFCMPGLVIIAPCGMPHFNQNSLWVPIQPRDIHLCWSAFATRPLGSLHTECTGMSSHNIGKRHRSLRSNRTSISDELPAEHTTLQMHHLSLESTAISPMACYKHRMSSETQNHQQTLFARQQLPFMMCALLYAWQYS